MADCTCAAREKGLVRINFTFVAVSGLADLRKPRACRGHIHTFFGFALPALSIPSCHGENCPQNYIVPSTFPFAASDEQSIHSLELGGSNAILRAPGDPLSAITYAQSIVLDQHLAAEERIDVVKIDVEGYEVHVFRGFRTLLRKFRPTLIGEFHPKALREIGGTDPEEYISELSAIYSNIQVITRFEGLARCSGFAEIMDHWRVLNRSYGSEDQVHLDLLATAD